MSARPSLRRLAALALGALYAVLAGPPPAFASRPDQGDPEACLVCHGDSDARASGGRSIYVDPELLGASVHGPAGLACVKCHTGLEGVEDFPHPVPLERVLCGRCHRDYARAALVDVHGTNSPRLAERPVLCQDCHGGHDVRRSSDPASPTSAANRIPLCGRCHPGAGPNYARGPVHTSRAGGLTAAGIVKVLYYVLIPVLSGFFVLSIVSDIVYWSRGRWSRRRKA